MTMTLRDQVVRLIVLADENCDASKTALAYEPEVVRDLADRIIALVQGAQGEVLWEGEMMLGSVDGRWPGLFPTHADDKSIEHAVEGRTICVTVRAVQEGVKK